MRSWLIDTDLESSLNDSVPQNVINLNFVAIHTTNSSETYGVMDLITKTNRNSRSFIQPYSLTIGFDCFVNYGIDSKRRNILC